MGQSQVGNWVADATECTISDHAIISGRISAQVKRRKLLITDWEIWSDFIQDEEKEATYQDPIKTLKAMSNDNLKYRLLNVIKDTQLEELTLGILADFLRGKRSLLSVIEDGREVTTVMIPKEGKDLPKAKAPGRGGDQSY